MEQWKVAVIHGYRYLGDVENVSLSEREKTECRCVAWTLQRYLHVPSFAPFNRVCRSHSQGHDAWKGCDQSGAAGEEVKRHATGHRLQQR